MIIIFLVPQERTWLEKTWLEYRGSTATPFTMYSWRRIIFYNSVKALNPISCERKNKLIIFKLKWFFKDHCDTKTPEPAEQHYQIDFAMINYEKKNGIDFGITELY